MNRIFEAILILGSFIVLGGYCWARTTMEEMDSQHPEDDNGTKES